jgi:LPXTG-motif cell wall-anchored protein
MKTAAIIILIAGLLMTVYTGFGFVTKEKVIDLGAVEVMQDKHHSAAWPPYLGIGVMVLGGALLVVAKKREN